MRILFLGNNWVGWKIAEWLGAQGEQLVGLVLHPEGKQKYGDAIIRSTKVNAKHIFDGAKLRESEIVNAIKNLKPDIGISALFGYILKREILELLPAGCLNIHPSLLPWNRGSFPNVWSIIDGTPAGVTLHYLDEGIDTGDIVAQREIPVTITDTGGSLYRRLEMSCVELFAETWPQIKSGNAPRFSQTKEGGTSHKVKDVEKIDEIDLSKSYQAKDLINLIRARTFPPYTGAWVRDGEKKVYLQLRMLYEEELKNEGRNNNGTSD